MTPTPLTLPFAILPLQCCPRLTSCAGNITSNCFARYLLAVNVMTASILRGVVEAALSELLAFFHIHASGGEADTSPADNGNVSASYRYPPSPKRFSSGGGRGGGGGGSSGGGGDQRRRTVGGSREGRRAQGGVGDGDGSPARRKRRSTSASKRKLSYRPSSRPTGGLCGSPRQQLAEEGETMIEEFRHYCPPLFKVAKL